MAILGNIVRCCCDYVWEYLSFGSLSGSCDGNDLAGDEPAGHLCCPSLIKQCWQFTVSGVTDNDCTVCNEAYNGTFVLRQFGGCACTCNIGHLQFYARPKNAFTCLLPNSGWAGFVILEQGMMYNGWAMHCNSAGNWFLSLVGDRPGIGFACAVIKRWTLTAGDPCQNEELTFTREGAASGGACNNWPDTITVTPLESCPALDPPADATGQCTFKVDGHDEPICDGGCDPPCAWLVEDLEGVTDGTCTECDGTFNRPNAGGNSPIIMERDGTLCRWTHQICGNNICPDSARAQFFMRDADAGNVTLTLLLTVDNVTVATYSATVAGPLECRQSQSLSLDSNDGTCATWPATIRVRPVEFVDEEGRCVASCDGDSDCPFCGCSSSTPTNWEFALATMAGTICPDASACANFNGTHSVLQDSACRWTGEFPVSAECTVFFTITMRRDSLELLFESAPIDGQRSVLAKYRRWCGLSFDCAWDNELDRVDPVGGCTGWPATITISPIFPP